MNGVLDTLCSALDAGLRGFLFARKTATVQTGDGRFDRWVRDMRWKREVVELV